MRAWRGIIHEAHRRYVWQVLAVYVVAAWLGHRLVLALHAYLGLHDFVPAVAAILFIIGAPMVAATAVINGRPPARRDLVPPAPEPLPRPEFPYDVPYSGAGGSTAPLAPPGEHGPLLSWRRSLAMGVVAFALLGAGTSGYMGMQHFGVGPAGTLISRGVLEPGAEIMLLDFTVNGAPATAPGSVEPGSADGSALGFAVAEGLRLHLLESPAVKVSSARGAVVITGDVATRGAGLVIRARVLTPDGSRVLASFRENAADSTALLETLDLLARRLRAEIGESLRTVRAARPLPELATASLPAFIHYAASMQAGRLAENEARAVTAARAAVQLDSTFALAWLRLGTLLLEAEAGTDEMRHALKQAYALRERLRPRERVLAEARHAHYLVRDPARAVTLYESMLHSAPRDEDALHDMPVALIEQRRFAEAEPLLAAAIEHGAGTSHHWSNLVVVQYALGRTDDAAGSLAAARAALPNDVALRRLEATFAMAQGDWRRAETLARAWLDRAPAAPQRQGTIELDLAGIARAEGRLRDAAAHLRRADAVFARAGAAARRYKARLAEVEIAALTRVDRPGALRLLAQLEQELPLAEVPAAERPYLRLAETYAWAGDAERAQQLLDAFDSAGLPPSGEEAAAYTRGVIELARGDVIAAVGSLRAYTGAGPCTICGLPVLGHALEAAEEPEAALEAYERYLATPYLLRSESDAVWRAFVLGRAAELHHKLGDPQRAAQRYGEFVRLWQRADPELQPQVAAATRRIRALNVRSNR